MRTLPVRPRATQRSVVILFSALLGALPLSASSCGESSDAQPTPLPLLEASTDAAQEASADAVSDEGSAWMDVSSEGACKETLGTPLSPAFGTMAAEFSEFYRAYDLGPIPPPLGEDASTSLDPLGGCAIAADDPNKLYFVGRSESVAAAVYAVQVLRDDCGHILSFAGAPTLVTAVEYADANLVYAPGGILLLSQYPVGKVTQLGPGLSVLGTTELFPLGIQGPIHPQKDDLEAGESPGGLGLVPPYLQAAGGLRAVAFPSGRWYHLGLTPKETSLGYEINSASSTVMLDNGPGAFAYVPSGSPGFPKPAVILTEWFRGRYTQEKNNNPTPETQRVVAYEVNEDGDPVITTRREFFTAFDRPWGAYFEPVTGDFLFLTWMKAPDHMVVVRGFVPPPPVPK